MSQSLSYHREFMLSASHFNGEEEYSCVWRDFESIPYSYMMELLRSIHGHNFKIEIDLIGVPDGQGMIVSDEDLSELVMVWDNTNLSVHSDFLDKKIRATTEEIARILVEKLLDKFSDRLQKVTVKVWETPQIYARFSKWVIED